MQFPGYPFTGRYLDLGGHRLHYLDEGPRSAEPVVMLHGNPTWSYYYRRLVAACADRYRCVVPDHVGMGLSDKPPADRYRYTLASRVDDLGRLLEATVPQGPINLVLHDWGGMIGMAWAARHADRVRCIAAFNTAAFGLPPGKRLPWELKLARLPLLGELLVRGRNAFCRAAVRRCVTRPLPPDVRAAYLAPYDSWQHRLAVHRFVKDIPLSKSDPAFALVREVEQNLSLFRQTPLLLCWGMQDFVFDETFLEAWLARFPQAEVQRFADAGHFVLEDAAEQIVPLVRQFLDRRRLRT